MSPWAVVAIFVIFAGQMALSLTVKKKWIHWIPTVLFLGAGCVLYVLAENNEGWDVLGYLLMAILAWIGAACATTALILGAIARFLLKRNRIRK